MRLTPFLPTLVILTVALMTCGCFFPNSGPPSQAGSASGQPHNNNSATTLPKPPLYKMTTTVNGVILDPLLLPSPGAALEAIDFDPRAQLNASLKVAQLNDALDKKVTFPCAAGTLTVENRATIKAPIQADSSVCFSLLTPGSMFQIPSNRAIDELADEETRFVVFGDKDTKTSFLLNAHSRIKTTTQNVCVTFPEDVELAASGETGAETSISWSLCQLSDR